MNENETKKPSKFDGLNVLRINTHAGTAHRDEILAVAVLMWYIREKGFKGRFELYRSSVPLPDADYVLDMGGKIDIPELGQVVLDHHQCDQKYPTSSFELVLTELIMDDYPSVANHVVETVAKPVSIMDHCGPVAFCRAYGMDYSKVAPILVGPLEKAILIMFEACTTVVLDGLTLMLEAIGTAIMADAENVVDEVKHLQKHSVLLGTVLYASDMNRVLTPEALRIYRRLMMGLGKVIEVTVTRDNRGPGLVLYRYDDNPKWDFSKLAGDKDVAFAHKGGFLAKTKDTSWSTVDRLIKIVERSFNDTNKIPEKG